jgi:hypothetical protein
MTPRVTFYRLAIVVLAWPLAARAELPLTIEDLLSDKGQFRTELGLVYANSERRGVEAGETILVQTGPAAFVAVPTRVGASTANTDAFVATLGLRYGLAKDTELYARASMQASTTRREGMSLERTSDSGFADAWLGLNHRFLKDDKTPALLGFVEAALAEKQQGGTSHGQSWLVGLTTYRAIDPLVLSATAAWRLHFSRADGGQDLKPGNLFLVNPSVGFAVNDKVTLTGGMQWRLRQADERDGLAQGMRRSSTDLTLGLGYAASKQSTLNLSLRANVSGSSGAEMGLTWLYKLDRQTDKGAERETKT